MNKNYGLNFPTVLTLVFITLKLTGFINWSWWWVLSPFYIPIVILIIVVLGYILNIKNK